VLFFAPFEIRGKCRIHCNVTEMLSIHGTAMQITLRDFNHAAPGCPSNPGNWPRPVAKYYRDFRAKLDR
jgi:hypothetical protein